MKKCLLLGALSLLPMAAGAFDFETGWTLSGNGKDKVIDVPATFGDANVKDKVQTVWKWDPVSQKWAFYAPSFTDGGVAYAASKGYQALKSILPGEGFWVNASSAFTTYDPAEPAVALKPWQLVPGWNLVATGAGVSPAQFNTAMAPFTATTVWAWDRSGVWYFYSPTLTSPNLASYILTRGYRDFGSLTLGHGTGFWVNRAGAGASPTAGLPAVEQAKQLVAELRTTGTSWGNLAETGALDAQVNAMNSLSSAIAVPATSDFAFRLGALNAGETMFRRIKAGDPNGYSAAYDSGAGTTVFSTYQNEYTYSPVSGPIPGHAYYTCRTNPIGTGQPLASVTCDVIGKHGISYQYNWSDGSSSAYWDPAKTLDSSVQTVTFTRAQFAESATAGTYTYGATLRQSATTYPASGGSSTVDTTLPGSYAGSMQKSFDVSGVGQTFSLSGELPSTAAGSAKMTVSATATRTVVSGGTCTTVSTTSYCPTRYDIAGALSGVDAQGATVYSLALDTGSQMTMMESALGEAIPNGASPTDANLLTTLQVAGSRFSGRIAAQNFGFEADATDWQATTATMTGTLSDISAGGTGTIFNGNLVATLSGWSSFHSQQPLSSVNYPHIAMTMNGTLQLPSRPLMALTLAATKTGPSSTSLSGQYAYGDGVTLTIAGTMDGSTNPSTHSMSLTNQDGVVLTLPSAGDGTLYKASTQLGLIQAGIINYNDGSFESWK